MARRASGRPAGRRSPLQTSLRLYGRHAVLAALANPARQSTRLNATAEALSGLDISPGLPVEVSSPRDLAALLPEGAPHQGLVLTVKPLPPVTLADILGAASPAPLVFLDQVTDPHNVGAILRSAAAFGAAALVTQDRHSPPESGALARAASGTLEVLPWVRVTNLARALDLTAEAGYWRLGLAGEAETPLREALAGATAVALVIGSEGEGLRHNVRAHCDILARLPISPQVESLNASNAAAVALYAAAASRSNQ